MTAPDADDGNVPAQDAESHFVTVVKFDIVDSTGVWKRLSRPDGLELRRGFRSAVAAVVQPFDVKIEWEGDGALLAFGYPQIRVDSAETAVRTGLELVDAVQSVANVPGVRLALRVGIASGPVTIDLRSGMFSGDLPITLADRLMKAARPGQVIIGDDTKQLVRRFFEYEDLGMVSLKGLEGTRVWRVVHETSVVSRFDAQRLEGERHEIVGRADALSNLASAWAKALSGHGTAVSLVGDAGMGKSRLARDALDRAERDGALVLEIDCRPSTGNSPLLPIGVLLRRTARIAPGASDAEKLEAANALLARLLGDDAKSEALTYLAPLFGIHSAAIPLDKTPEQVQAATITTIVAIVRALASRSPLALLCEDLHWADDTTAHAVQRIAEIIGELHAMALVTRWPKAVTPIDLDAITAGFETIAIEPLSASNAADLVRAVAGDSLTPERIDGIVTRCGGVPLLLEEVTRATLDAADAVTDVRATSSHAGSVPPELQLVVESRIARWPDLKGIIEAASVLGREFPVALLQALVPGQRGNVPAALAVFADHGLLAPPASGTIDRASFRHGLIRDAVYDTLVSRDYLRRLHGVAADTLMTAYAGTPDASPDVLAQHLKIAGRLDEAVRIRLAAADDTFKRGAYIEAKGHCDAAQQLIDEIGDRAGVRAEAFQLCVLRGMVGAGIHGYSADPVEKAYREAQEMFDGTTGPELRYPVIRGLTAAYLVRGDLPNTYRYSLECVRLSEQTGRPEFRIDAMSLVAYTTFYAGRLDDCLSWINRCMELYDTERGDTLRFPVPHDPKTAVLALLPTVAWLLGDPDGAEAAIARGLEHVERLNRDFDRADLHAWLAGTRYTQRRYLEAAQHAGLAYTIAQAHKFQEWIGVGGMMALLSQTALQPSADGIAKAIEIGQAFKAAGVGLNASYFLWGIARGLLVAGNAAAARATLDLALQAAAASEEDRMSPEIQMLQAEIETDPAESTRLLLAAFDLADQQGAVANALRAAAMLVTRTSNDPSILERAQSTLKMLNGGSAQPHRPDWMIQDLACLKPFVGPVPTREA